MDPSITKDISSSSILLAARCRPRSDATTVQVGISTGHHSSSMTAEIYCHWIPGEGKKDLTKTLRGPKARPDRTLALATGADSPQVPQEETSGKAAFNASLLGTTWCKQPKQKA